MEMTPEKLAFITGEGTETKPPTTQSLSKKSEAKAIQADEAASPADMPDPSTRLPRRKRQSAEAPGASEVLDQVLVPVTIRLPHRVAQALRRAHLEQRLKHAKPDTQQEIVFEAVSEWLSRNGFNER
jgi:hypothetical protein